MSKKRLAWRCRDIQQQRDKAEIYNSKEWKQLREAKLQRQPKCEMCLKEGRKRGIKRGYVRSATCVHHIVPIETAKTKDEMRRLAFDANNLRSLCFACHARIHKELGSNTAKIVRQRAEARQDRWKDNLMNKFIKKEDDENKPTTTQQDGI